MLQPLRLRCPACAHVRHDQCAGIGHCSCRQCHGREIVRDARQRYESSNSTAMLRSALGAMLALDAQRQIRQDKARQRAAAGADARGGPHPA